MEKDEDFDLLKKFIEAIENKQGVEKSILTLRLIELVRKEINPLERQKVILLACREWRKGKNLDHSPIRPYRDLCPHCPLDSKHGSNAYPDATYPSDAKEREIEKELDLIQKLIDKYEETIQKLLLGE